MKVEIKGITPTQSQKELITAIESNQYKFICAAYSRQQGKTTTLLLMCIRWLMSKNEEIIYFTPTYNLAKNLFSKLVKLIPQQLIKKANSADLIIEIINGNTLRFFSGESAQTARGSNCTRLIIDEAAYIKDEIDGQSFWYNIVLPLLKAKGKTAILISTPFAKTGFFYDMCMKGYREEPNYKYIKKTIYDDGLISPEEIEELKKGYPEMAWKCEFMCEFVDNAMSVFPAYEHLFKENFTFNHSQCWIGVDLSTVGTDNTVLTVVNSENQAIQHIIKGALDDKYQEIAALINKYRPVGTYVESNSIGTVMFNEIVKHVKDKTNLELFTTTNDSKKQYISLISNHITNNNIEFDKSNKTLFTEFGTFSYKLTKSGNVTYAATSGNHDDTVISLGLALQAKEDFKFVNQVYFQPKIKRNILQ